MARGSLWNTNGGLDALGAAGVTSAVKLTCRGEVYGGTPVGEGEDPTEATPPHALAAGEALVGAIDGYLAEVKARLPETDCPR